MRVRACAVLVASIFSVLLFPSHAGAQQDCRRFVIFTLPAVSWEMVGEHRPPNLLRIMEEGSTGAMSVRTNSSRTSYASGFVTIGAGTRTDGGRVAGSSGSDRPAASTGEGFASEIPAGGAPEIRAAATEADYVSTPGALAEAMSTPLIAIGNADLGRPPPSPLSYGRWTLLAAMDASGHVIRGAVGSDLLKDDAGAPFGVVTDTTRIESAVDAALDGSDCGSLVIDQGDLIRADTAGLVLNDPTSAIMATALTASDDLLGYVDAQIAEDDLLLVVSPTSPWWDRDVHLGVAVAKGPGFPPGYTLESASTRERRFVTLPDIAPTALAHLDVERPSSMIGRPFVAVEHGGDLIDDLVLLDKESVFAHRTQAGISTSFVVFQILVYALAIMALTQRRGGRVPEPREATVAWLARAGLGIVAFPLSTYLATPLPAHKMGAALFIATLVAIDIAVVLIVSRLLADPLERLLAITASTLALFIVDLSFLQALQLNAVWGNDPIVAGRFTGLGNIAFAILGSSSLMTGALLVHRYPKRREVFVVVAVLFALTIVVDGAPSLGSDVGGVLALGPALGITFLLLAGKRPSAIAVVAACAATALVLGLFLAVDFARPPENRTHLARLVEDVRARGSDALTEALGRKVRTNLRVFRSTIWTYLVPPALGIIAWLLLRPGGRWHLLAVRYPKLRAGLIGGLLLAVTGFAVNDSGIVVPAMVLSFLAPMSLSIHLLLEQENAA